MSGLKYQGVVRKFKGILFSVSTFLAAGLIATCVSCETEDPSTTVSDLEFFPLQKGWFQVYDVEKTTYTLGIPQSVSFQLKTVVADSFKNAEGGYTYVLHRSTREQEGAPWIPEETWSARVTNKEAVVTESGTPYVALRFPVREGAQWNGNAYNHEINPNTNNGEDLYVLDPRQTDCMVGTLVFPQCATVTREDNQEFIVYHDLRRETYALGVGLVKKETIQLHYCTDDDRNCIGQQIIEEGVVYKQEITAYGYE